MAGINTYIYNELKKTMGSNKELLIPTLADVLNVAEYHSYIENKYNSLGIGQGNSFAIRMSQGSLLDKYNYVYFKTTDTFLMVSSDADYIKSIGTTKQNLEKVLSPENIDKSNKAGFLETLYWNDTDKAWKRLIGKNRLTLDNCIIIPREVVNTLYKFIDLALKEAKVILIQDDYGKRYFTKNVAVLSDFNGNAEFSRSIAETQLGDVKSLRIQVPVVGAPLTSSGLGSVNVLRLDRLALVKPSSIKVQKPFLGADREFYLARIKFFLNEVVSGNEIQHAYGNTFAKSFKGYANLKEAYNDFSHLPDNTILAIAQENSLSGLPFSLPLSGTKLDVSSFDYSDLSNGIYRITYVKKSGKFGTYFITNDLDLMTEVYGSDYIRLYESVAYNMKVVKGRVAQGMSLTDATIGTKFSGAELSLEAGTGNVIGLEAFAVENYNWKPRESNTSHLISARRFFADMVDGSFISLKPDSILSIEKLK